MSSTKKTWTTMKLTLTYLSLALFALACNNKQSEQVNGNISSTKAMKQTPIKGTWTIEKYYFSDIYAMDEKKAKEWLNKSVLIDDKLHFDFQKIDSYKDVFKNENECTILNIDEPELVTTDTYFDTINDPLVEMKIDKSKIKIYKTSCKDNPFGEFVVNEDNEIVFRWDGVFFIMTKK